MKIIHKRVSNNYLTSLFRYFSNYKIFTNISQGLGCINNFLKKSLTVGEAICKEGPSQTFDTQQTTQSYIAVINYSVLLLFEIVYFVAYKSEASR